MKIVSLFSYLLDLLVTVFSLFYTLRESIKIEEKKSIYYTYYQNTRNSLFNPSLEIDDTPNFSEKLK